MEVHQRGARQQPGDVLLAGESLDVPAEVVHAAPPKWMRSADRSSPVAAQPRRARAAPEGGADGAERLKALLAAVPGLGAADSPLSADSSDIVSSAQKEARDLIERHQQSRSSTAGSSLGGGGPAGDDEASSALDSALDPL